MATTNKNIIRKLLREGTTSGPVTQKMIDYCFTRTRYWCKREGKRTLGPYAWMDFLGEARKEYGLVMTQAELEAWYPTRRAKRK